MVARDARCKWWLLGWERAAPVGRVKLRPPVFACSEMSQRARAARS